MDWLKTEKITPDKTETIAIAAALGLSVDDVFGKLFRLWSWADSQTIDGLAKGVPPLFVDQFVKQPGFAEAMKNAGWLVFRSGSIEFPNFERHMGESAKKRAQGSSRGKAFRDKKRNATSVTDASPEGDKRREENTNPPKGPATPPEEIAKQALDLNFHWTSTYKGGAGGRADSAHYIEDMLSVLTFDQIMDGINTKPARTEPIWDFKERVLEKYGHGKNRKRTGAQSKRSPGHLEVGDDLDKRCKAANRVVNTNDQTPIVDKPGSF